MTEREKETKNEEQKKQFSPCSQIIFDGQIDSRGAVLF